MFIIFNPPNKFFQELKETKTREEAQKVADKWRIPHPRIVSPTAHPGQEPYPNL